MTKPAVLLAASLLLISLPSAAEIEKTAIPAGKEVRFLWWPKVMPPSGWHFDQGSSQYFSFNAMAPDGNTFSKSENVIYAKANYKPRSPEIKSLAALIQSDIAGFVESEPGTVAKREGFLKDADGKRLQVVSFTPTRSGNWERVAYGEEGDFYLVFTVSSRTKKGLAASMPAFESMLAGYRERH
jgi:hypothetical protein